MKRRFGLVFIVLVLATLACLGDPEEWNGVDVPYQPAPTASMGGD